MPQSKYQQYFQQMLEQNPEVFNQFSQVHELYLQHAPTHQAEFNAIGRQALNIIREWERKLCRQTENGGYGKYSTNLSEKFWQLVRKQYPKIDMVGVELK